MFRSAATAALLAAAGARAFDVVQPSADAWWVADNVNLLVWNCHDNGVLPMYTVFALNPDVTILTDRTPLIAQLDNTQCSHQITQAEIAVLKPAPGYSLQFVDPVNTTNIVGTSGTFEVKSSGSQYSTVTATPAPAGGAPPTTGGSASGSATSGGATPTTTPNAASRSVAAGGAAAALAVAAVGFAMLL